MRGGGGEGKKCITPFEKSPQKQSNKKQTEKTPTQRRKKAMKSEKNERVSQYL